MDGNSQVDALIGYTGFVGSSLLRDASFAALYNSRNIREIRGKRFRRVVCAGVSAVKWWANRNPQEDLAAIALLMDCLAEIAAERFVLISTVDVYGEPRGVTEREIPSLDGLHPYGRHRLELERWVARKFADCHIVRLPALFGPGLKKNAIYDLIHNNALDAINPESCFQWYPVVRLARDLLAVEEAGIRLLNMSTPPLRMRTIVERYFPNRQIGSKAGPASFYDMHSIYGATWGRQSEYLLGEVAVSEALEAFLSTEPAR
jgi:hypothetical protein